MRLIDADSFEENLENSCKGEQEAYAFVDFLNYLDKQPTGYDIEKVVKQVEELIEEGYCPKNDNPDFDCSVGGQCCKDCWHDRLLEIIKTGGNC